MFRFGIYSINFRNGGKNGQIRYWDIDRPATQSPKYLLNVRTTFSWLFTVTISMLRSSASLTASTLKLFIFGSAQMNKSTAMCRPIISLKSEKLFFCYHKWERNILITIWKFGAMINAVHRNCVVRIRRKAPPSNNANHRPAGALTNFQ